MLTQKKLEGTQAQDKAKFLTSSNFTISSLYFSCFTQLQSSTGQAQDCKILLICLYAYF